MVHHHYDGANDAPVKTPFAIQGQTCLLGVVLPWNPSGAVLVWWR